ncbi:Rid family hydrolase [Mycobacteroides abscessus]|uniref:Rid family hydrolase n=1 Tax=Mycobacteroides abscessus TaxID=36809 RepID=UPI001300087E|nr:Rid family hydrolase [Mycobacteroides abscessus]
MIKRLAQDDPWEVAYGYTKAVTAGPWVLVSGHTSFDAEDTVGQARAAFRDVLATAQRAGAKREHVVRTRIFYTDAEHTDAIAATFKEVFGSDHPPAATMVRVAGLMLPQFKVEIELEAYLGGITPETAR